MLSLASSNIVTEAALEPSTPASKQGRAPIAIMGVPFDNVSTIEAVAAIEEMIAAGGPHYLVTANVDFLVQAQTDVELRRILFDAHMVVCDGTPLLWASKVLGNSLVERVAGADLVPLLIEVAARKKYRLFFLGATPESSEAAVARLRDRYEQLIIAGNYSPPFGKLLEMDHAEITRRIHDARPDILLVSFGCPKQEKWIAMHYRALGVPVAIGVGATIDFLAGQVKRAPKWMQRSGTEWIFRLAQEPRRLFRRYSKDLWVFGNCIVRQWFHMRRAANLTSPQTVKPCDDPVFGKVTENLSFQIRTLPSCFDANEVANQTVDLESIINDGRSCVLDMRNVTFIDSTGIGTLIHLKKRLHTKGCDLIFVAPSPPVESTLKLMRLEHFFVKAADLKTAQKILEAREREVVSVVNSTGASNSQRLCWQNEITAANAEEVWTACQNFLVAAAEGSHPEVVIDLSDVPFMDSSGLGVMVKVKKLAQRHGTKLVFTGLQAPVLNVLQLSRMQEFLLGKPGREI